jgi:hypothetical protein
MRVLAVVLLVLLLSACGGEQETVATSTPTPTPTPTPTLAPTPTPTPTPRPTPTPTPAPPEVTDEHADVVDGRVVLEPDGLGVADETDSVGSFGFYEADQTTVTDALQALLGSPTGEEQDLDCGPGPLDSTSWAGFTAYFADGTLTGWYLQDPAPADLTTADGIGLGTRRAELEESFGEMEVEETSIGIEFFTDSGLAGTLSDDAADATVEVVWAGESCIAR